MNASPHVPRPLLEALVAGDGPVTPEVRGHVDGCPVCRERVESMKSARASYLAAHPAPAFAAAVMQRAGVRRPGRRPWFVMTGSLALAGVALAVLVLRPRPPEVRVKGGVPFEAFARRADRTWRVSDGERLRAGDRLAFTCVLPDERRLLLLGIDDAGAITRYDAGARLPRGRSELPVGIELDARPGEEKLFAFFFATAAPEEGAVRAALSAALASARRAGLGLGQVDVSGFGDHGSLWYRK
jgi:hypothetical protein